MSLETWIDELGRELQQAPPRRRRRATTLVAGTVLAALVAMVVLLWPAADPETPVTPAADPRVVAPAEVLERTYMGVACPEPNRIGCDRVGIFVDVKPPARAVTAEVGGRRVVLDDPELTRDGAFAGYLQPAGLAGDGPLAVEPDADGGWTGYGRVSAPVTFVITLADGSRIRTTETVELRAGWG